MPFTTGYEGLDGLAKTPDMIMETDKSGFTVLVKIPADMLQTIGNHVRLVIEEPLSLGTITTTYISQAASSGHAYDADTTPTQITWDDGATSRTMVGGEAVSDWVTFAVTKGKAIIVGFNLASSTYVSRGVLKDVITYDLTGVQEADNTTRTASYNVYPDTSFLLKRIEIAN